MNDGIRTYIQALAPAHRAVGELLARELDKGLPASESRIWHAHPVWFLDGNPIAGFSLQKPGVRLMFWSGADFQHPGLVVRGGKFKDASVFFNHASEVDVAALRRWLQESRTIQWDYKNIRTHGGLVWLGPGAPAASSTPPARRASAPGRKKAAAGNMAGRKKTASAPARKPRTPKG